MWAAYIVDNPSLIKWGEVGRGSLERDTNREEQEAVMRHFCAVHLHFSPNIMSLLFN